MEYKQKSSITIVCSALVLCIWLIGNVFVSRDPAIVKFEGDVLIYIASAAATVFLFSLFFKAN